MAIALLVCVKSSPASAEAEATLATGVVTSETWMDCEFADQKVRQHCRLSDKKQLVQLTLELESLGLQSRERLLEALQAPTVPDFLVPWLKLRLTWSSHRRCWFSEPPRSGLWILADGIEIAEVGTGQHEIDIPLRSVTGADDSGWTVSRNTVNQITLKTHVSLRQGRSQLELPARSVRPYPAECDISVDTMHLHLDPHQAAVKILELEKEQAYLERLMRQQKLIHLQFLHGEKVAQFFIEHLAYDLKSKDEIATGHPLEWSEMSKDARESVAQLVLDAAEHICSAANSPETLEMAWQFFLDHLSTRSAEPLRSFTAPDDFADPDANVNPLTADRLGPWFRKNVRDFKNDRKKFNENKITTGIIKSIHQLRD